jgi:hypothetical protein
VVKQSDFPETGKANKNLSCRSHIKMRQPATFPCKNEKFKENITALGLFEISMKQYERKLRKNQSQFRFQTHYTFPSQSLSCAQRMSERFSICSLTGSSRTFTVSKPNNPETYKCLDRTYSVRSLRMESVEADLFLDSYKIFSAD